MCKINYLTQSSVESSLLQNVQKVKYMYVYIHTVPGITRQIHVTVIPAITIFIVT